MKTVDAKKSSAALRLCLRSNRPNKYKLIYSLYKWAVIPRHSMSFTVNDSIHSFPLLSIWEKMEDWAQVRVTTTFAMTSMTPIFSKAQEENRSDHKEKASPRFSE